MEMLIKHAERKDFKTITLNLTEVEMAQTSEQNVSREENMESMSIQFQG